jgi:hypothetical protein
MPYVELLPVPTRIEQYRAYLMNNFRRIADALNRTADKIGATDIEITDPDAGIILVSPDATRWRVTVDDLGALIVTSL